MTRLLAFLPSKALPDAVIVGAGNRRIFGDSGEAAKKNLVISGLIRNPES
jgi:hypothetical protein